MIVAPLLPKHSRGPASNWRPLEAFQGLAQDPLNLSAEPPGQHGRRGFEVGLAANVLVSMEVLVIHEVVTIIAIFCVILNASQKKVFKRTLAFNTVTS